MGKAGHCSALAYGRECKQSSDVREKWCGRSTRLISTCASQNPISNAVRLLQQQGLELDGPPSQVMGVETKTKLNGQQCDTKSDLH